MENLTEAKVWELQHQTLTKQAILAKYIRICSQEYILQGIHDMKYIYSGYPAELICDKVKIARIFTN